MARGRARGLVVGLSTEHQGAFLGRAVGELDLGVVCMDGEVLREHWRREWFGDRC